MGCTFSWVLNPAQPLFLNYFWSSFAILHKGSLNLNSSQSFPTTSPAYQATLPLTSQKACKIISRPFSSSWVTVLHVRGTEMSNTGQLTFQWGKQTLCQVVINVKKRKQAEERDQQGGWERLFCIGDNKDGNRMIIFFWSKIARPWLEEVTYFKPRKLNDWGECTVSLLRDKSDVCLAMNLEPSWKH